MDTKQLMEWSAKYHTPNYGRTPLVLVRGEGSRVWDSDGKEYLDFTSGIAVTSLGHCHPVVTGAIREAAATLLHVSNIFHNAPQIHLAKMLIEHSFADRVFFCNSGAEANEAALKVVRKYAKEKLATDRYEVIATHNSFHGRTLATVSATGQPKYQHGFEPLMPGFKHVPYNDLRAMERAMDSHTAAILVEPIQGEGGVYVPDDGYLAGLRKLCDESGALLVFDEVQTGVGRTGRLWGYEHWGVEPDVMTLAKALANGIPIGAMLCREHVASALTAGTHGSTFAGSAVRHLGGAGHAHDDHRRQDPRPRRPARARDDGRAARAPGQAAGDQAGARQGLPDRHRAVAPGRPGHGRLPRRRPARADRRREGAAPGAAAHRGARRLPARDRHRRRRAQA